MDRERKRSEIKGIDWRHTLGPGALRDQPDRASVVFDWLGRWRHEIGRDGFEADDQTKNFHRENREHFEKAVPFIWTDQMWTIGLNAAETMPDSRQRGPSLEMPFDDMLWAWKAPVTLWSLGIVPSKDDLPEGQTLEEAAKEMECFWMLIYRTGPTVGKGVLYGRAKAKQPPPGAEDSELVWMKSADFDLVNEDGAVYRGLFAFLDSPWITYDYQGGNENRAERKRMDRAREALPPAMIEPRFVMLRRALIKKGQNDQGADVAWTHQWMVSGHWRDQWLPSSVSHRMTWIAPYIKGPPDLPLRTPVRLVAR